MSLWVCVCVYSYIHCVCTAEPETGSWAPKALEKPNPPGPTPQVLVPEDTPHTSRGLVRSRSGDLHGIIQLFLSSRQMCARREDRVSGGRYT